MVRGAVIALMLCSCAYDYDGAFGEAHGGGEIGGAPGSGGGAGGEVSDGGQGGTSTTATEASTSTGLECICAPPGTCDGNNVCNCPASALIESYPTIAEGTNGSNQGWVNVTSAAAPDASAAQVTLGNNQTSEQLTVRGYDFNGLPNDATLVGIQVDIDRCRVVEQSPVDVKDSYLRLASAGGVVGSGTTLAGWGACGGPGGSYQFPVVGIGPAQVKNDFAVHLRVKNENTGTATGYLNTMKMTVTYQPTCAP